MGILLAYCVHVKSKMVRFLETYVYGNNVFLSCCHRRMTTASWKCCKMNGILENTGWRYYKQQEDGFIACEIQSFTRCTNDVNS